MTGPVPVAEIVRSGFVEGHHYGSLVALAADGSVDWSVGAVDVPMLPRSCNKPVQALGMVRLGLDLPDELLALACASHSGEPFHVEGARRILALAGLDESALQTPADYPLDDAAREVVIRAGGGRSPVQMNCSGKHAAMLATCVVNGWDTATYPQPDHPLQVVLRDTFAELTGEPVTTVATDGCGAPLFSTSLVGLARAFRRLALGHDGDDRDDPAARRVAEAIRAHPEHVSGTARDEAVPPARGPRRHRQGRCGVLLRGRARRRPSLRAQGRRRRPPGPSRADGRRAGPQRRRHRARRRPRGGPAYRPGGPVRRRRDRRRDPSLPVNGGPVTGRARGFLLAVFVAYLVALAVVLLGPSTQPGETGVSGMLRALWTAGVPVDLATPERVEVLLNVVLLVPLPLIGGGIWPSLTWRDWTAYGFALALGAELWQGLAFEARSATYSDVVANTTGVFLGAAAAAGIRWTWSALSAPSREE